MIGTGYAEVVPHGRDCVPRVGFEPTPYGV
jgi:hypothetical protein